MVKILDFLLTATCDSPIFLVSNFHFLPISGQTKLILVAKHFAKIEKTKKLDLRMTRNRLKMKIA